LVHWQEMKSGANERLQRVMFLPLEASVDALRAEQVAERAAADTE
jgi:hypothetical protein